LHAILEGSIDDVGLHHQVLINEVCGIGVVGVYAAYLGGG